MFNRMSGYFDQKSPIRSINHWPANAGVAETFSGRASPWVRKSRTAVSISKNQHEEFERIVYPVRLVPSRALGEKQGIHQSQIPMRGHSGQLQRGSHLIRLRPY